jgi:hypothetical protein
MKQINFIAIICAWLLCTANQCSNKDCHNVIPFVNNSDKPLYVTFRRHLSDTLLSFGSPNNEYNQVQPYSKNATCIAIRPKNCFNAISRTSIYVFDKQILSTITWDTVKSHYMVLCRYDLTPEDLELLNWEVPYPPDERMKNMKMYPPYKEE